jgi:ParB/RepB/Spo0J family partition protein
MGKKNKAAEDAVAAIEEEFGIDPSLTEDKPDPQPEPEGGFGVDGICGKMTFALKPLADLKTVKGFRKTEIQSPRFIELAKSVKQNGLINPLIIVKNKIISGRRRFEAAKTAGLKTVPVIEVESNDAASRLITFIDNAQRENLNPIEEAKALQALLDDGTVKNQAALAKMLGVTQGRISQKLAALKLNPKLKKAMTNDRISASAAVDLKDADDSVIDAVLGEALKAAKPATREKTRATRKGKLSVPVLAVEKQPEEIGSIRVSAKGAEFRVSIIHPNKTWGKGEFGAILKAIAEDAAKCGIDSALTSARTEIG